MMELVNELLTTLVKLVVTAGGSYLIAYGLPWLKKIGLYKMVQIGVMAAGRIRCYQEGRQERQGKRDSWYAWYQDHSCDRSND